MLFTTKFLNININYIKLQDQLPPPPQKKSACAILQLRPLTVAVVLQTLGLPKIWGYYSAADVDFSLSVYDLA